MAETMNRALFFFFAVLLAVAVHADVTMTYPAEATIKDGSSVLAGFVSPGQVFDLVFSDNYGSNGLEWSAIEVPSSSLPAGWSLVSTGKTEASLSARLKVPVFALPGNYSLKVFFYNADSGLSGSIDVRIVVKKNLLEVSFARVNAQRECVSTRCLSGSVDLGEKVLYKVKITNSSIAPETVRVSSTLPPTWFSGKEIMVKQASVIEEELVVVPQASGRNRFSFTASAWEANLIVGSFGSELNVKPTLKGKFGSAFSGFPFFTFSLLPFQLFDSFFALVLPE